MFGTVLPWHADRGADPSDQTVPNWKEHHREIDAQVRDWAELKLRYPKNQICIAGDYNTDMGTGRLYGTQQGISAIKNGLKDIGLTCATEPGRIQQSLIDHISVPCEKSVSLCAYWPAVKGTLSDHSGVIIEVT